MILVVASLTDSEVQGLATRTADDVVVLTPLDLSAPGWAATMSEETSTFVAAGRRHETGAVKGVVTRLVAIPSVEMLVLANDDREYAACESTAFMAWWLSRFSCPVVNAPDPTSLVGRSLHPLHWASIAIGLGITIDPSMIGRAPGLTPNDVTWCTTFDGEPTTPAANEIATMARLLAKQVPQRLAGFAFTKRDEKFCGCTPLPGLDDATWSRVQEVCQ